MPTVIKRRRYTCIATAALLCTIAVAGITASSSTTDDAIDGGSPYSVHTDGRDAFSQPLPQLPADAKEAFFRGRSLFRQNWVIAPARDDSVDGLGPLHNRISCIACHTANGKGHAPDGPDERAASLLLRLSVPGDDGYGGPKPHPRYGDQLNEDSIPGVPPEGRVVVSWQTHAVALADGTRVTLRKPVIHVASLNYGPLGKDVMTSPRVGSPVFGLGLLEAVPEAALQRIADEAKPDGIRGRLNVVHDFASGESKVGRFGLKSNRSTLRDQIAAAMSGDLGITSSLTPHDNCMPSQTACRQAPNGGTPELDDRQLHDLTLYLAWLAPPAPRNADRQEIRNGATLFRTLGCVACHRDRLPLDRHPLLGELGGTHIAPYTDLLLHDMGTGLADGRPDYRANGNEWRTPPLWGIGLQKKMDERTGYLHDGRARTVEEAILWHGGEAQAAQHRYTQLTAKERAALLAFINSL